MAKLRLAHLNNADDATLTANPAAQADGPVTYLQIDARGYTFQAAAAGAQEIKGTWATAQTLACCVLYRTNLANGDTVRLQLYSDTAWTTGIYDSGTVDAFTSGAFGDWDTTFTALYFTEVTTAKSFKLTVTSAAALTADRIFLGPYVAAPFNPKFGARFGWDDSSKQERLDGGTLRAKVGARWRTMQFDMMVREEADRAAWAEIARVCGRDRTVWVDIYPAAARTSARWRDHAMLAKFEESPSQKVSDYRVRDLTVKLQEM